MYFFSLLIFLYGERLPWIKWTHLHFISISIHFPAISVWNHWGPNKWYQSYWSWNDQISCNSSSFHWVYIQRWRSFLAASQPLWVLRSRKHATTSHVFYYFLLQVRRGVGIFSRCAGIGIMHKLSGFHMRYKTSFEHQSMMHQRRLSPKNPRCKSTWISCRWTQNQFLIHQ